VLLNSFESLAYRKRGTEPKPRRLGISFLLCLVAVFGLLRASRAQDPKELRIAAASDLQPLMPAIAGAYEKATGIKLVVSFGSSGTLATQIVNGAPFDVFLGADFSFPEKVVAAGLTDAKAPTPYARGALVLWARKDSPVQPITIDSLTDKRATKIAIADEAHAPYGRAAVSALIWMKIYEKVKPHLVVAENVAQAGQFAQSGNAQLALISMTLATSAQFKEAGTMVLVPKIYPPIRQCAVVLKAGRKDAGDAFLKWLISSEVQGNLHSFGLDAVQ
jgi:molybdate transport system substrate-binding protein